MKISKIAVLIAAIALLAFVSLSIADSPHVAVTICHIPPGNPANAHTITVDDDAVPAHVANHGDTIGPCAGTPPPCDPANKDCNN